MKEIKGEPDSHKHETGCLLEAWYSWCVGGQLVFFWCVRPGPSDEHRCHIPGRLPAPALIVLAREVVTSGISRNTGF